MGEEPGSVETDHTRLISPGKHNGFYAEEDGSIGGFDVKSNLS